MEVNCLYHFVIFFVSVFVFESISASGITCSLHLLVSGCQDPNESCIQQSDDTGVCKCKEGYTQENPTEPCMQKRPDILTDSPSDDQPTTPKEEYLSKISGSAITASILIPLVLSVAAVGLWFAARRYRWLHRLPHIRHRHYDEVRIGQEEDDDDDPPIA